MKTPIFPLGLVLFPGQVLPLHIFEERYKQMLQRCLSEQIPFGIVLVRDGGRLGGRGSPHAVGTLARVTKVEEIPEGRCVITTPHRGNCYHIVCRGEQRFRVTNLDRREAEYLVGEIELLPDEPAPLPAMAMVAHRVVGLFDDYYRHAVALSGGWQREVPPGERTLMVDMSSLVAGQAQIQSGEAPPQGGERTILVPSLPEDPTLLANVVAAELSLPPRTKQELLECPTALARLQREAELLAEETPQLEERLRQQHRRRFTAFGATN
jgi:Lon protease-like protein